MCLSIPVPQEKMYKKQNKMTFGSINCSLYNYYTFSSYSFNWYSFSYLRPFFWSEQHMGDVLNLIFIVI